MSDVDANGQKVLTFETRVRNLVRVAELEDSIVEMAQSGAWRNYSTGVGRDRWLEAEFDYFLISCGVAYDDIARVVNWSKDGASLAPLMDRNANSSRRRAPADAAAAWHSPGPESLVDRARRLGWLTGTGRMATPVPRRARIRARRGMSADEIARASRDARIPAKRRRELGRMARDLVADLDDDERRYLVDQLRKTDRGGRPPARELNRWRRDNEELDGDSAALAERWGVAQRTARWRIRLLREAGDASLTPTSS